MYTIDANIFVRDTDSHDPDYATCHNLLSALDRQQIPVIVPNLLLVEVAGAMSRTRRDPIRARLITTAIESLKYVQFIPLNDDLTREATEIAADRGLRGADAVYVAVARHHNCILVSLDREQRERAQPLVRAITPEEALAELQTS